MSSIHKVLAEMEKTQPRRMMANRVVMLVLGGIIIVGMFLVVGELNQSQTAGNEDMASSEHPEMEMAMATQANELPDEAISITVTLNRENQWVVADHGALGMDEMRVLLEQKSAQAEEEGLPSVLRVRIAGDESARYLVEMHRLAKECGLDHVNVVTVSPGT
ncbi:MAG: hypothetical protein R3242_03080 [Akkermansiaceae bacterium]|nr:hypothetical protein [Akkermansiaceae bacterium]